MEKKSKGLSSGVWISVTIGAIAGFVFTNGNPATPIIIGILIGMSVYSIQEYTAKGENEEKQIAGDVQKQTIRLAIDKSAKLL